MCGIIAVLQRPARRQAPARDELLALAEAATSFAQAGGADLDRSAEVIEQLDRLLRGTPGIFALVADADLAARIDALLGDVDAAVARLDEEAAAGHLGVGPALEAYNATASRLKDASWAVRRDRLRNAREVEGLLSGHEVEPASVEAFAAIQIALSAIDRLEVRGRDSAGLHLLVEGHDLDVEAPEVAALLAERRNDALFQSMAVRTPRGMLSLTYKAAAEIGELGDNTRALRAAIAGDELLHRAVATPGARVVVLGHTRWASVGIISEANAHPLNSDEDGIDGPYVTAALNGDVDNYIELRTAAELRIPLEVTTDAKVIPALVSRRIAAGVAVVDAFRETVATFDGSVAIAAHAADDPEHLLLALRGSGQALYVGLADDAFVVASEPYGLVEETMRYLRLDGETPSGATGDSGQIVVLDRDRAGDVEGIHRLAYDGTALPVDSTELAEASITTRDIDRAGHRHYLIKELTQSPQSLRKTLLGRLAERGGRVVADLGEDVLSADLVRRLGSGGVRQILVVGQGTAAIAGRAVAAALTSALPGTGIVVEAHAATELSGFHLDDDMSDVLVVAISQSGTTTDTNRTVDLARARGASVLAIVNRRNSDLVQKADGVLYTSDGRDVEMAVPSSKAFYAQVAAGFLLAGALGEELQSLDRWEWSRLLTGLRALPDAMTAVLGKRDEIARAAAHGLSRRHWGVVGSGTNSIAAAEIRIKLSELCYKSIGTDSTEDKKHIDLSAEPLVFMCAAGLTGPNAADAAKEVAMWRAHKAAPIVVATEGTEFPSAVAVIDVPNVHPELAFVLSAMVGHLFGYEAALAIDAQARPLREMRGVIEGAVSAPGHIVLSRLASGIEAPAARFMQELVGGAYNGHLEVSSALLLSSLLRYARGQALLDDYQVDFGVVGTPHVLLDDLGRALTKAIDELTRPIDAIKHQAKTITVGISRSEDELFESMLVRAVLDAGAPRDRLSYRCLRTLAALDPAVVAVTGYTRYSIEGDVAAGTATITTIDKSGIASAMKSRADGGGPLQGTKNRAARQRLVTVAVGPDGRTIVVVPETKGDETNGITLLHTEFRDCVPVDVAIDVLSGYQSRLAALRDAVTEFEPAFRDEVLGDIPIVELLNEPVHVLARHWR